MRRTKGTVKLLRVHKKLKAVRKREFIIAVSKKVRVRERKRERERDIKRERGKEEQVDEEAENVVCACAFM